MQMQMQVSDVVEGALDFYFLIIRNLKTELERILE
jgi:hypothetical protein